VDSFFMEQALSLAEKAKGRTTPNPLVGAVVVKDGQVVGQGYHQKAGGPHAEVFALDEAGEKAQGATIYVTLEPCSHYGRTPPCTKKIIAAGIKKVVVAMIDPNPKVAGRGIEQLKHAGIEVVVGVEEEKARALNEVFLKYITTGQPFVILKTGMSLDGKIATKTGESRWITGPEARAYVHQIRDEVDAIMVGIGTVMHDNPQLTTRLPDCKAKDPIRVIVDSKGQIPLDAQVLNLQSQTRTIVAATSQIPPKKIELLQEKGAQVLIIEEQDGQVNMHKLLEQLGKLEITSILLEGGSTLNGTMVREKLIDKIFFFIAPKIISGRNAPGPIGGDGIENLEEALFLKQGQMKRVGDDWLIEAYPDVRGS